MAGEIYADYTDLQESFGIDECWLDCTASTSLKGDGMKIANEISARIKYELGITVSIGVSWNKIFAKLGSDYKKIPTILPNGNCRYFDFKVSAEGHISVYHLHRRPLSIKKNQPNRLVRLVLLWWR